ncbi:uncharacterized protein KY384_001990 [Bacidia gigantensis]|uniref:uncharacterized protein n=1 Tax=Bacidia gigantensis TaxID=2732470 RepID=UPI001D05B8BF|nr:uncharacterized protein KY384_001990 [Bacidia gigantensis]KAG8533207.1 hypothetical protein KY384_001990 [Bacidia gigantensis]
MMGAHIEKPGSQSSFEPSPAGRNELDPEMRYPNAQYDDLQVECPPHTTQAKLIAKVDLRVIPVLSILYFFAFLDRTNIANAAIFGLQDDLKLGGNQYNTALTIFFVPYIVFEIPSNIILKRLKPHVWLSGCMFVFGLVTVCQGLVKNWSGLLVTRFFLGLAETGMFPGSFYLIGMWYKRSEAQKRYSFFFGSTSLAGAFGGLLASAIGKMNGMRGYHGWRWIFILEGTLTCLVALAFYFVIPSFPEDANWCVITALVLITCTNHDFRLTHEERHYIRARLETDQGKVALERRISPHDVLNVFKDFKVFFGGFMYLGLLVPAYGYAFFAPGIIRSYGYSQIQTQLHSVPPWACSFVFALIVAYFSDLLKHRFFFTIFTIAMSIAGFAILLSTHTHKHLEYGALFLVTMGTYSALPVIVCWFNMNLGGHHRRAVGTAWQIGFGNISGIIATYAFLMKDAPEYRPGFSICIGFACLSGLSCLLYALSLLYQNRWRAKQGKDLGLGESEKAEMGDLSPDYRYLL